MSTSDRYTSRDARAAVLRLASALGVGYMPTGLLPSGEKDEDVARCWGVPVHRFARWRKDESTEIAGCPPEGLPTDRNTVALSLERAPGGRGFRVAVNYSLNMAQDSLAFPRALSARALCTAVSMLRDALLLPKSKEVMFAGLAPAARDPLRPRPRRVHRAGLAPSDGPGDGSQYGDLT